MADEYKTPDQVKQDLLNKLGDLSDYHPQNNQALCAIYKVPEKTKGGIIMPDKARDEDEYQGKTLLVVKTGPIAFQDDGRWFQGIPPKVGDWIVIRASDGWALRINGVPCRMLDDVRVRMIVPNPESIW